MYLTIANKLNCSFNLVLLTISLSQDIAKYITGLTISDKMTYIDLVE